MGFLAHPYVVSRPVGLKAEVEPGACLKHQAALHVVFLPANDDDRGCEADHIKVQAQFVGCPHLTMLGFQVLTAAGAALISASIWRRISSVSSVMVAPFGMRGIDLTTASAVSVL